MGLSNNTSSAPPPISNSSCDNAPCASDIVSIGVTSAACLTILFGILFLWWKRRTPEVKAKQVSLLILQGIGSIFWLVAILTAKYAYRFQEYGEWLTCYFMQVWVENAFGYCLVVTCYLARAYRLYYVFVRRRLPRLRSWQVVSLLLLPALVIASIVQGKRPFIQKRTPHFPSLYCSASIFWWLFLSALHAFYIGMLMISTWLVRNIRFEFNESKELVASVCASVLFLGVWLALLFVGFYEKGSQKFQNDFQSVGAYILIILCCATALCFSFFPVIRPLKTYLDSLTKHKGLDSMGKALGVPASGLIHPYTSFRFDEPLDALLQHKRFRQAFQAFADSRVAGESVRFYTEVSELKRILSANTETRIYMAQHIIETYIEMGSPMEINISHAMRNEILGTKDLSNPTLFDHVAVEAVNIMKTNLESGFWQSKECEELKEEVDSEAAFAEQLEWMNVSSKRDSFSTSDNLFELTGSPNRPFKAGSMSPIHRALLMAPGAASPDDQRPQVQPNTHERSVSFAPRTPERDRNHYRRGPQK